MKAKAFQLSRNALSVYTGEALNVVVICAIKWKANFLKHNELSRSSIEHVNVAVNYLGGDYMLFCWNIGYGKKQLKTVLYNRLQTLDVHQAFCHKYRPIYVLFCYHNSMNTCIYYLYINEIHT